MFQEITKCIFLSRVRHTAGGHCLNGDFKQLLGLKPNSKLVTSKNGRNWIVGIRSVYSLHNIVYQSALTKWFKYAFCFYS